MTIYNLLAATAAGLLLFLLIRSINDKFAVFVTVGGSLLILLFICSKLSDMFSFAEELGERIGVDNKYFNVIFKGLSICYISEFTVWFCRDCGQSGWADKIEMACRCALLTLAIPLFEDFLTIVLRLME
jgi:stage III sporulation protein AD